MRLLPGRLSFDVYSSNMALLPARRYVVFYSCLPSVKLTAREKNHDNDNIYGVR